MRYIVQGKKSGRYLRLEPTELAGPETLGHEVSRVPYWDESPDRATRFDSPVVARQTAHLVAPQTFVTVWPEGVASSPGDEWRSLADGLLNHAGGLFALVDIARRALPTLPEAVRYTTGQRIDFLERLAGNVREQADGLRGAAPTARPPERVG